MCFLLLLYGILIITVLMADAIAAKREAMLARLAQRHANEPVTPSRSEEKADDVDKLLERALLEIQEGRPVGETEKLLEDRLTLERTGYVEKRIRETLIAYRKAVLDKETGGQKKGFSFARAKKSTKNGTATTKIANGNSESKESEPVEKSVPVVEEYVPENAIVLRGITGETRLVTGVDGADVRLKDIRNCTFRFALRASAVHIQNVQDCTFVFLPLETSVLTHDCERLHLFADAQQIRVHTSNDLQLHVGVRGAVILETCTRVGMAPYRVVNRGEKMSISNNDNWRHPNDFDFLAEGQSPNWRILEESEWREEVVEE